MNNTKKTGFRDKVYEFVKSIPAGKVVNYGYVALAIGSPCASRQVGYALRALGIENETVPWWRVVNSQGYLSINHGTGGIEKMVQKDLLEAEGVEISKDLKIDMQKYFWDADVI